MIQIIGLILLASSIIENRMNRFDAFQVSVRADGPYSKFDVPLFLNPILDRTYTFTPSLAIREDYGNCTRVAKSVFGYLYYPLHYNASYEFEQFFGYWNNYQHYVFVIDVPSFIILDCAYLGVFLICGVLLFYQAR